MQFNICPWFFLLFIPVAYMFNPGSYSSELCCFVPFGEHQLSRREDNKDTPVNEAIVYVATNSPKKKCLRKIPDMSDDRNRMQ